MAIIVPNTASSFTSAACVVGSENKWVWLAMATPIGASGCVMFFRSASATNGRELLPIVASPATNPTFQGPFNSPCGIYAASLSGGCAIVWMKA